MPKIKKEMDINNSFDLCDQIYCSMVSQYGENDDLYLDDVRKMTISFIWQISGILGNGGFQFLFEGLFSPDPTFKETISAYRRIGCTATADIFVEALNQSFPEGKLMTFGEGEWRQLYCKQMTEDERWSLEIELREFNLRMFHLRVTEKERYELADRFIRADKDTPVKLATYIRDNWNFFEQFSNLKSGDAEQ